MAESNILVRNIMLEAILDWDPGSVGSAMLFGAYEADASNAVVTTESGSYGTPSGGSTNITSNVVLNIPADTTISHLRLQKGNNPNDTFIYKKDITPESFTFAGTITITSAEITISD